MDGRTEAAYEMWDGMGNLRLGVDVFGRVTWLRLLLRSEAAAPTLQLMTWVLNGQQEMHNSYPQRTVDPTRVLH